MTQREPKYTLRQNGGPELALQELTLACTGLKRESMQVDEVTLEWTRQTGGVACPLAEGDEVQLYLDGHRIFVGRVRVGAVQWGGCSLTLRGPWSHFEEFIAHVVTSSGHWQIPKVGDTWVQLVAEGTQFWNGTTWVDAPGNITWTVGYETVWSFDTPEVGTLDVNRGITSRFWLFSMERIPRVGVVAQMTRLLAYAAHVADVPYFAEGTLDWGDDVAPKARTVQDLPLAEAIRQTLMAKPDAALWWDYAGDGLPVLNGSVASAEAATPLELTVGQSVGQVLPDYSVRLMPDLRVNGVCVREEYAASTSTGRGQAYLTAAWPTERAGYARRMLVQTVTEVASGSWALVGQQLYDTLNVMRAQGSLNVLDPDFSLRAELRPGRVLRLLDDPQLVDVDLWVQAAAWNPATGIHALTVGYPGHLSLQELTDLRSATWRAFYPPGTSPRQILQTLGES